MVGAAYIVWLAWGIATSGNKTAAKDSEGITALSGFGLQFVNVKIILYGVTSISTFVLPNTQELVWIIATSLLLALIALICNLIWAIAGKLLQSQFQKHGRAINITLAATLLYCAFQLIA
ncbi:transporter LysE family [Vibrio maritimus]|uniref:Transporter LysE family n=1 Tax=Vibrio maritimus TaxID=990268 RepID=A0A090SYI0_9VIBR|nr:transporter LysE family [Vibrio maritimus]